MSDMPLKKILQLASLSLLLCADTSCERQAPSHEVVHVDQDVVRLPLTRLHNGDVHFFTFKVDDRNVNFFIRTDGRGHLKAHFDACYSCFKYKLGYIHQGDQVVCLACRIGYDLEDEVWDYVGACVPISLKSQVVDSTLTLEVDRLRKGVRYF